MLRLRDLMQFPSFYSKRQPSIRQTEISITGVSKQDQFTEITGQSKKYKQIIRILGTEIIPNAGVSITCNCESFKFEFAHALLKNENLLNPQTFGTELFKNPIKKNAYLVPSGCKHIIALANIFNKNKHKYS